MYNCRNCGGNLRFDIPTQRLKCPYCETDYDCYDFDNEESAADQDSYDVTVFSCPACGGQIISNDENVADFCSYCGSSVIMESRMKREKRPHKIVPFQKTSEDCVSAYKKKLKNAFFAPRTLKDPQFFEKFRGIYIPYWSYSFSHKGNVSLSATHEYQKGDYEITDHYHVTGDIDAHYDGIVFDASASFDDAISEAIAPFDTTQMKDFVPAYLSGFYADVADVPADLYEGMANNLANEESIRNISRDREAGKYRITDSDDTVSMNRKLCTSIDPPVAAMLPVWFLTWRSHDRVAYIAVNGQTGKVAADIPIDIRKYLITVLLCSIPIYFILNAVLSLTAPTTLFLAGLFSLITGIIYYEEISTIRKKDTRELDLGFQRVESQKKRKKTSAESIDEMATEDILPDEDSVSLSAVEKNSKKGKEMVKKMQKHGKGNKKKEDKVPLGERVNTVCLVVSFILLVISFAFGFFNEGFFGAIFNRFTLNTALTTGVFFLWWLILEDGQEANSVYKPHLGIFGSQIVTVVAALINIIHPVSDIIYYVGITIVYLGIFITLIQVIQKYNLLITRPIPELHNRGEGQV